MSGEAGHGAADVETLVASFVAVTAATREEAQFFLESHEWQLDPAVASFFDGQPQEPQEGNENNDDDDDDAGGEEEEEEEERGERNKRSGSEDEDYVPSDNEDAAGDEEKGGSGSAGLRRKRKAEETSRRSSAVTTFSDLRKRGRDPRAESETESDDSGSGSGSGSDSDSDTDSDEDQDYYAGGEKSGMLVRGSSRKRRRNKADAHRMFYRAPRSKSKSKSFTGKGRLLTAEGTPSSATQQTNSITYNIYFWRNGFTVNNGPLRGFDDPQNADFIASIEKSQCPEELKSSDSSVEICVIRRETVYSTQASCSSHKRSTRNGAFRGTGRTLGTEPEQVPDTIAILSVLDESLPTTSLQIRLLDGTRLVARFNTSNTIGDLRAFIDASRPSGTSPVRSYQLQTVGFPPKRLNDESKTIEEEGIANSVVIQKA